MRLAMEGAWIVAGQVASVLGAFVLVRVLTEYLEPRYYGELALGMTAATLINQTVFGGLGAAVGRYFPIARERADLSGYFRAATFLVLVATALVVGLGVMLGLGLFATRNLHWVGVSLAALLFAALSGYNAIFSGVQNAARQRAIVAFHSALDSWLKILLAVGLFSLLGESAVAVMLGYAASALLVTLSQAMFLKRTWPRLPDAHEANRADWQQKFLHYALPFSVFGAFTWAQLASDRWALQAFVTQEQVGMYAVVYQLGYTPVGLVLGVLANLVTPILFQHAGNATDVARNRWVHNVTWLTTMFTIGATLVLFLAALFLHGFVFQLLVASSYQSVSYLLPWTILAGGLFSAAQILALKVQSELKPLALSQAKIVTALIGIAMNILGAMYFGIQGVAGGLVGFSLAYLAWIAFISRHRPAPAS